MAQFTPPPPPTPPPSPLPTHVHTHPFFRNVQKGDPLSKGTGLQTDFLEQTKEGTLDPHLLHEIQKAVEIAMKKQAAKRQQKKMLALPVAQSGGGGGGGGGGSKVKQQSIARQKQMPALSVAQTGGGGGGGATPQQLKPKAAQNKQLKNLKPTQGSLLPNQILPQGTKRGGRK
jgi:hypothetical protein